MAGWLAAPGSADIPPLTEQERIALETAFDGRDHREEAFAALLANARRWTPGPGDAAVVLAPDPGAMIAFPDVHRGELCRLTGVLQQQAGLREPFESASEWFLRDEAGRPVLVYVEGLGEQDFEDGTPVVLLARFYKRVDAVARDGVRRSYPAFVGAFPERAPRPAAADPWSRLWVVALPVAVMMAVFAALLVYGRRVRGGHTRRVARPGEEALDRVEGLPDDPAEALVELRRRAEAR